MFHERLQNRRFLAATHRAPWAVDAGYAPSVEKVEAVLDSYEAFAEDQFLRLLSVLGVPDLTDGARRDLLADGGQGG